MKKTLLLLLLFCWITLAFTQGYMVTENVKIDSIQQTSCHSCIIFASLKGASNALIYMETDTIELKMNDTYRMTLQWYPTWIENLTIHFDSCVSWHNRDIYTPFRIIHVDAEGNDKPSIRSETFR